MSPAYDSRGFEIGNLLDRRTFPRARLKRTGPPPGGSALAEEAFAGPPPPPRVRFYGGRLSTNAGTRTTGSSPRLQGLGLIRSFTLHRFGGADPPTQTVELGYSTLAVLENLVAIAVPRPYTVLTEIIDPLDQITAGAGQGFPLGTIPSSHVDHQYQVGLVVLEPEWFAVASLVNNGAGGQTIHFEMQVVENLTQETLPLYF